MTALTNKYVSASQQPLCPSHWQSIDILDAPSRFARNNYTSNPLTAPQPDIYTPVTALLLLKDEGHLGY